MRANAKKPNKPQVATTRIGWPEERVTYKRKQHKMNSTECVVLENPYLPQGRDFPKLPTLL